MGLCCRGFGCHEVGDGVGLVAVRYGWSVRKNIYIKKELFYNILI